MQLYYPVIDFEINEVFAIENPYPGKPETPVFATFAEGIHLILYSNNIEQDLPVWGTKPMLICLAEFEDIPFIGLIFDQSEINLLYSFSVYSIIGDMRAGWLRSLSTTINVVLVDNTNGRLACVRTVETKLLAKLRHFGREQMKAYADAEQVQTKVESLLNPPAGKEPVHILRVYSRASLSNLYVLQKPISKPTQE